MIKSKFLAGILLLASAGSQLRAQQPVLIREGGVTVDVTAGNALKVDGSAVTQPVSAAALPLPTGAATEATLSSLNGKVTAVNTGAVVVSSSALPTGASTAAKQPALGTAGTASADVITVQGIASMTPLLVNGSGSTQPISGTVTAVQGTGSNLHVVCDSGCTPGGSFADDSAFTFGTTAVNVSGFVFDDTSPNTVTENNAAAPRMSGNRVPYSILRDAAGNERGVNVTAANALKVDNSGVTQPVSGTVTAAQATAANLNATVVGTGTFAVQAAQSGTWTVQPGNTANTTAWLVTGTGGTFPATQSGTWNINNVSGTVSLPTGASTLAEQQTQTTSLQLLDDTVATTASAIPTKGLATTGTDGTNARIIKTDTSGELQIDVLTLPSNASVNVAQINGVTPLMGAGNTGTGSPRVTVATDQAAVAAWGFGATGAAPPTGAHQVGGIGSGATGGLLIAPTICDQWADINTAASAQIITGVSGRKVYFCSGNIQMNGGANTLAIVSGTGSTCGTGTTSVPGFSGGTTAANGYSFAANSGMTWGGMFSPFGRSTNNADNICILLGTATRVVGALNYAIY